MVAEFTVAEFSGCPVFHCPVYRCPVYRESTLILCLDKFNTGVAVLTCDFYQLLGTGQQCVWLIDICLSLTAFSEKPAVVQCIHSVIHSSFVLECTMNVALAAIYHR